MTRVETILPILRVDDLGASIDYYVDVLGFALTWRGDPVAEVGRDRCALMLCQGHQGQKGTWVWIGVDDVDALLAEIAPRGARVRLPPTNFPWAWEMHIEDPDGHVLRFGSEPKPDLPFGDFPA